MGERKLHLTHWGLFEADVEGDQVTAIHPYRKDPDPPPHHGNMLSSLHHPTRISQPYVRAGWLEDRSRRQELRGRDEFVALDWDEVLDLLAQELRRVYQQYGAEAIYGGSYGWGSAGRFHHAQSQVHRFLNTLGGYTASVGNYSYGASQVLLPHVVGSADQVMMRATTWRSIVEHTQLIVAFGGLPARNAYVATGGVSRHQTKHYLQVVRDRGTRFVLVSPIRDDIAAEAEAQWLPIRPGADVAFMLSLCHTLLSEGRHDEHFLTRYCVGFDRFRAYLAGETDGQPKTPEWAETIAEIPSVSIRSLARQMAETRTLVSVSWSLQRADFGEQPVWTGLVLAAMLGQIGLPGGGFGHGYASSHYVGHRPTPTGLPTLPQGKNPVDAFIPVARVADMLFDTGQDFDFDGRSLTYPDIRLVYWCGGNPFHHHQDLNRLRRALTRPETIVVHEPFWTQMARHADIVLPCTVSLERNDLGAGKNDPLLVAMPQLVAPHAQARNDYNIFAKLSHRLGTNKAFTKGRSEMDWVRHLYEDWRTRISYSGYTVPPFETFWREGSLELPIDTSESALFERFRMDPAGHPLDTPSGRIEIHSTAIESLNYADCPGHPQWLGHSGWLSAPPSQRFPLHLIANQPSTRLHSQLDVGNHSMASKLGGREPIRIHPIDAAAREIIAGDVVRVFNDRGSCLAGAVLSENVRPGVVQLSTGAWYDPAPDDETMCVHGNPSVLTCDRGSSRLGQGCTGQHILVEVARFNQAVPPVRATEPPPVRES